jgi:predicted nucleic acid-binding protein
MRIVIDTNKVFSAILSFNGNIAKILIKSKTRINFYSSSYLMEELENHREKIIKLTNLSDSDLTKTIRILTKNIRLIDAELMPIKTFEKALALTHDIDIDDTDFIALTDHIKGKFWSGDKELIKGKTKKGWDKFISNDEILAYI